jgi:hypothetical protein
LESRNLGELNFGGLKKKFIGTPNFDAKIRNVKSFLISALPSLQLNYGGPKEKILLKLQTLAPNFGTFRMFCSRPSQVHGRTSNHQK